VTDRVPSAYHLIALDDVDSTNSEARRQAEAGAPDGTLITAKRQSAGRGRRGRAWQSPAGNLYMSLLLRPDRPVSEVVAYSFIAIVALGDAIASLVPPMVALTYKWPNDLLVHDRKCAGVLLESATGGGDRLDWLVIGIGVNLVNHPDDLPYPATDLEFEGAGVIAPETVTAAFARQFLRWSDRWRSAGFAEIRRAWLARAHGIGGPIVVRFQNDEVRGTFQDIDEHGHLLLERDGQVTAFSSGELFPVVS
jgi:BirA family biotin operon repressor/biotin-[acetyl-CoA-carboxylase] ligase